MFSQEENEAFLLEAGQPVTVGGALGRGVLSYESEMVLSGESIWRGESLLVLSSLAEGVSYGSDIIVNGNLYRASYDPMPSADGVFSRIALSGPIQSTPEPVITLILTTATGTELSTTTGTLLIAI